MLRLFLCFVLLVSGHSNVSAKDQSDLSVLSYDARLTEYKYPFEVKTHEFQSQGQTLQMAYMFLKGKSEKPVVTLLHGKNFNGAYWEGTARYLNSLGFSVLMPDQIGFGKSTKTLDYQYSFAAFANNTKGLMQKLGIEKSIIMGHSMGGMLASRFALLYPEVTQKLILLNPIGLENYLEYVNYKDVAFFHSIEKKKTAAGVIAYQTKNYYDGKWTPEYEALTHFLIGLIQGPDKDLIAHNNALTYDMIFTQPVITEFQNIKVPVVLILGTRDRTGPGRGWKRDGVTRELGRYDRLGSEVLSRLPSARLIELEGLGHLPQVEDFERYKAALDKALQ